MVFPSIIRSTRLYIQRQVYGIEILQGRWQHGEKVGYCYPSELEKTLLVGHICPTGHERVKEVIHLLSNVTLSG